MRSDTWWLLRKSMIVWLVNKTFFGGWVTLWPPASHNATWHHFAIDFAIWDGKKKSYGYWNSAPDRIYSVKMCIICAILSRNRPHQIISVPGSDPRECCDRDRCGWLQTYMLLRRVLVIQLLVSFASVYIEFWRRAALTEQRWHRLSGSWRLTAKYPVSKSCWKVLTGTYLVSGGGYCFLRKQKEDLELNS